MIGCILLSSNVSSIVTLPRLGPRVLITTGMLLGAGAMTYLTQLTVTSSYVGGVLPALLILGLGFGMIFAPAINTATAGVPRQDSGVASALVNTMQQVGGSIGTARAEHHRADRDGQLPRRAPHGTAGAGDRGHPRVHRGLRGVRGNLRSRRDPRDRPAAIPAAARRTQGRRTPQPQLRPPPPHPRAAAAAPAAADLAPQLEVHAIPVALPCCSPVINPASLPAGRPAG